MLHFFIKRSVTASEKGVWLRWLYIEIMLQEHGGLSIALPIGGESGNRRKREDLLQREMHWLGNMKLCSRKKLSLI